MEVNIQLDRSAANLTDADVAELIKGVLSLGIRVASQSVHIKQVTEGDLLIYVSGVEGAVMATKIGSEKIFILVNKVESEVQGG